MGRKLYFRNEDSERCHELSYFKSDMKDAGVKEMSVFRAKAVPTVDYFWCSAADEACEKSETLCGKICEDYQPRNGKNGRCRFHSHCYEPGEKRIIIKV
jgi:hypothetical protein